jgi:hypothetical protein
MKHAPTLHNFRFLAQLYALMGRRADALKLLESYRRRGAPSAVSSTLSSHDAAAR